MKYEINHQSTSFRGAIVSEKHILPLYYTQPIDKDVNKINVNNNVIENTQFVDYLLEVAERGEFTNEFKEYLSKDNNENTSMNMNPNTNVTNILNTFVQQMWSLHE